MTGIELKLAPQPSQQHVVNIAGLSIAWIVAGIWLIANAWAGLSSLLELALLSIPALVLWAALLRLLRRASKLENAHQESLTRMRAAVQEHYGLALTADEVDLATIGTKDITAFAPSSRSLERVTVLNDGERVIVFYAEGPLRGTEYAPAV